MARLAEHFEEYRREPVRQVFLNAGVDFRSLALAPGEFRPDADSDAMHAIYREHSLQLSRQAAREALRRGGFDAGDVDLLVAATCTGYMCPGLSAQLAAELGMRDDLQRADVVGMGCAGAMPALQRGWDYVRAHPGRRALVVAVEISSACWYVDKSMETVVGNAICADGAAAVVLGEGAPGSGPKIERFQTLLNTDYLDSVGLEFRGGKHRIVLDARLRHDAGPMVQQVVERLLAEARRDGDPSDEGRLEHVDHWVMHSGGRKVLDGIESSLALPSGALRHSRAVFREHGNMSSPTVLFVLERAMRDAVAGEVGVMGALGPGLAAETALLQW